MGPVLRFYWSLFLRRLPVMAVLFLMFAVAGLATALRLPPTYETSARLIVETPQIPDELASSTVRISATEEIEFIRQRLFTRTNLLEIQQRLNVLEDTSNMSPDQIVEVMRESTDIRSFESGSGRRGEARPTLVTVQFEARSGVIAANVVNEFVTRIINENVTLRANTAEDTLDFFSRQVERLNEELGKSSLEISKFQRENSDALPGDLSYRQGRLALLQERIAAAERERTALAEQKLRLQTAFERTGGFSPSQPNQLTQEQRQLNGLKGQLRQALTIYSETNPNVVSLRNQIELLEAQIEAEAAQPSAETNTAALMLELQSSEIDSRIESLTDEIRETEVLVDELAESVNRTPNVAVTLDALQRDYENVRLQYDNAIQALARANTGDVIERTSRGQRITLIEAATVPDEPSSPNRPRVAMMGIGLGGLSAIGFFVLLELLNRTIRRPVELTNSLGLTPIATIPFIESRRGRITRRTFKVLVILAFISGALGGIYYIDTYYMPIELIVQKVIRAVSI